MKKTIYNKKETLKLVINGNDKVTSYRLYKMDSKKDEIIRVITDTFNIAHLMNDMQGSTEMRMFKRQLINENIL